MLRSGEASEAGLFNFFSSAGKAHNSEPWPPTWNGSCSRSCLQTRTMVSGRLWSDKKKAGLDLPLACVLATPRPACLLLPLQGRAWVATALIGAQGLALQPLAFFFSLSHPCCWRFGATSSLKRFVAALATAVVGITERAARFFSRALADTGSSRGD